MDRLALLTTDPKRPRAARGAKRGVLLYAREKTHSFGAMGVHAYTAASASTCEDEAKPAIREPEIGSGVIGSSTALLLGFHRETGALVWLSILAD